MTQILYRIAQLDDLESVFSYESAKGHDPALDEIENQIVIWNSHFRKEALEHYFKLGWSFLALDPQNKVVGFFMGQPLLFVDKQTQSLWVEYISADNDEIYTELVDIAYRLSREKHFQKVLFSDAVQNSNLKKEFPFKDLERKLVYLKTTK
jgi:hypothetical protein